MILKGHLSLTILFPFQIFDEVIRQMVTSRNISPFGYVALIGDTKLSIYLTYAEQDSCTYDRIWTLNFAELRKLNIGKRIELIDFTPNCEEFIAISNTGDMTIWSLKKQKFVRKVMQFRGKARIPVTQVRMIMHGDKIVVFSQPSNLIVILDIRENAQLDPQTKIRSEKDGLGHVLSFTVE